MKPFKYPKALILSTIVAITLIACKTKRFQVEHVENRIVQIDSTWQEDPTIDSYIAPYRKHINQDLSKVLSYSPTKLDKNDGKWQNPMTNLFADAVYEISNEIFHTKYGRKIDFCILNHGGIRAPINKGAVTTRTAYEIMPFENTAVVLELKGEQIYEMATYLLENAKAHPLSQIQVHFHNQAVDKILIQGQPVQPNQIYTVVTNDYLAKGGDWMTFLTKAQKTYDLDMKLRDQFISYFSKVDTLRPSTTQRIIIR